MRIKWGQDLATGLLFILVGIGALIIGWDYPRGTSQRPGTGVLPAILSWCLIGTGGLLMIKSVTAGDEPMAKWAWRPFLLVTVAVISFGMLVDDLGLILTMIISMGLCALATLETRWVEFGLFALIMIAIGVGMFVWMLGMPIPALPGKLPSIITTILR